MSGTSRRQGRIRVVLAGFPLLAVSWSLGGCSALDRSEVIQLSAAPAPVRQAIEREARGGKVIEVRREGAGETAEYEAEVVSDEGQWLKLELDPAGTVKEREQKKRGI